MYAPAHFREERAEVLRDAIRNIAFATLVTGGEGATEANHIPLLLKEGTLSGHFARANPVWKTFAPGAPALAIFMGPHFYTSPSWYPSGDQNSSLVYQGSIAVPDECSGGLVSFRAGGTFSTGISSTDTTDKVNVRWHYSGNGSAGGWSGTKSVVPN